VSELNKSTELQGENGPGELTAIRYELDGPITRVALARPEARNAVNLEMCLELQRVFAVIEASDARVVVITGDGPSFCAGADMKERNGRDEAWIRARRVASFAAYRAIEQCSIPVVAAVHGAVVGSGGEISMSADFIVADASTKFRFPEVHWGTIGATQRLQRLIGRRQAKELLFTNRVLLADEAQHLGLVQMLIEPDGFDDEVWRIAERIAEAPPLATRLTKRAVDLGSEVTLDQGIRIEMAAIEQNLAQGDWRKGLDEFAASQGGGAA